MKRKIFKLISTMLCTFILASVLTGCASTCDPLAIYEGWHMYGIELG